MLRWALAFFVIAIIAAILGFGGIAVAAAGIAKDFVLHLLGSLPCGPTQRIDEARIRTRTLR